MLREKITLAKKRECKALDKDIKETQEEQQMLREKITLAKERERENDELRMLQEEWASMELVSKMDKGKRNKPVEKLDTDKRHVKEKKQAKCSEKEKNGMSQIELLLQKFTQGKKAPVKDVDSSSEEERGDDEQDSDSDRELKGKKKKKKSGLYRKASDNNRKPQEWPHLHLKFEYTSKDLGFRDLRLNTLVAGELDVIENCSDSGEKKGRMAFLKMLMYYADSSDITCILDWYADWVRRIEMGENNWGDDPSKSGATILGRAKLGEGSYQKKAGNKDWGKEVGRKSEGTWFCSAYNRNRCVKNEPHISIIKGISRHVRHICATCYMSSKVELKHPECSSACPNRGSGSDH
jgi:hypothetical protein